MIIHCSIAFDECHQFNEMSFSQRECGEKKKMRGGYSLGYYLPRLRGREEKGKRRLRQSSVSWNRHWSVPSKSLDPLNISDRPGYPKLVMDLCLLHAKFLSSTCGFWNLYLPCLGALWGFVPFFRIWSQCLFLRPVFLFWSLVGARGGRWPDPTSSCWKVKEKELLLPEKNAHSNSSHSLYLLSTYYMPLVRIYISFKPH